MTILILADRDDLHADCIVSKATDAGLRILRISPVDDFSRSFELSSISHSSFTIGGKKISTREVSGVYCRIALERMIECFAPRNDLERFSIEEESSAWLSALLSIAGRLWVNDPRFEIWADVKPHSLLVAQRLGLAVPQFIITNSVDSSKKFTTSRSAVIKQISDTSLAFQNGEFVSIPSFDAFDVLGTRLFDPDSAQILQADTTPFFIQEYVKRTEEFRVTVVDDSIFVAKSQLPIDRIDIKDSVMSKFEACSTYSPFFEPLKNLSSELGLRCCTFDVIKSEMESLHLVDINPSGNWLWLDELFDGSISKSIVKALT